MSAMRDLEGMRRALEWAASGDTGVSSETILAAHLGVTRSHISHPHDMGDFGRCLRLLRAWPEAFTGVERLAEIDPYWSAILDNWKALSAHAEREDVANNNLHDKPAPLTGKLLSRITDRVYRKYLAEQSA